MAGRVPQDLDQLIAILRRALSGVGITGDVSSAISAHAADADAHHAIVTITSGAGLTGGGDLSADRTVAVGAGAGITVNADDVALTTPGSLTATSTNSASGSHTHAIDSTIARSAVTITAGNGLTGGGDLTANRTIDVVAGNGLTVSADSMDVGAGDGLTVSADAIALTTPGTLSVSSANTAAGNHTHGITSSSNPGAAAAILATTAAGLLTLETLAVTGNITAGAVNSHWVPALTDTYDLGSATKLWRKGWLSELESVLFVENTITAVGGWFIIPHGQGTLAAGVGSGDTAVDFGQSMSVDDFVIMRGNSQVEYLKINYPISGTTYNVTRNVDGSGANSWPAGQVFIILGNEGNGRIEFDAQSGGPRISILSQGATYNAQTEVSRFGDLNGNWGYSATTYGIALGEYASNKPNLVWDPTNGLRIRTHATDLLTFDVSGNADISGVLRIGASGGIYQGTGTFASPTTGLKLWNDEGVGRLAGYSGGLFQAGFNSNGQIEAAQGTLVLDRTGLHFDDAGLSAIFTQAGKMQGRLGLSSGDALSIVGLIGNSTNLVSDPGFETTDGGWTSDYTVTRTTAQANTGTYSLYIVVENIYPLGTSLSYSPYYTVSGAAASIRFFIKPGSYTMGLCQLFVTWNNSGGTTTYSLPTTATDWTEVFVALAKPAGSTQCRIIIGIDGGITPGGYNSFYLDDLEVLNLDSADWARVGVSSTGVYVDGTLNVNSPTIMRGGLSLGDPTISSIPEADPQEIRFYSSLGIWVGQISVEDITWLRINQDVAKDIYTPRAIVAVGGLSTDASSVTSDAITYTGNLIARRSSTSYTGYIYVPITQATSTDWDGDSKSAANNGILDLSALFSIPVGVKAVNIRVRMRSATVNNYVAFGPDSSIINVMARTAVANTNNDNTGVVNCNTDGDIYVTLNGTCEVWLYVQGYYI